MFQRRLRNIKLSDLAHEFGRSQKTISRITHSFLLSMHAKWKHLLTWQALQRRANEVKLDEYKDALRASGCPDVISPLSIEFQFLVDNELHRFP